MSVARLVARLGKSQSSPQLVSFAKAETIFHGGDPVLHWYEVSPN